MPQQNDERSADMVWSEAKAVGRTENFLEVLVLESPTDYATTTGRKQSDDGVGNTFVLLLWSRAQRGERGKATTRKAAVQRRDINPEGAIF